ncbi:MAG: hypothetical protein WC744_03250 [Patescibacteria group bacterium]|jgi:hypothetical protein
MNRNLIFGLGIVLVVGAFAFFKQGGVQKEIKVGTDVCAEFPKEFIEASINKSIIRTKRFDMAVGTHVCDYYTTENDFLAIHVEDLSYETQKKADAEFGKIIKQDPLIKMEHFVAWKGNDIYKIYLKLHDKKYVSIDRGTVNAATNEENVRLAIAVVDRIQKGENQGLGSDTIEVSAPTVEPTKKPESNVVPLPQETDIVNNFISFIDEGKASDAVMMMSSSTINDDSTKQAYEVQYAAMTSVKVKKIEESSKSDWTDSWHQYMVTLDVTMDPSSANGPIPYYGYDQGENIRFLNLIRENNVWKIEGLATGP